MECRIAMLIYYTRRILLHRILIWHFLSNIFWILWTALFFNRNLPPFHTMLCINGWVECTRYTHIDRTCHVQKATEYLRQEENKQETVRIVLLLQANILVTIKRREMSNRKEFVKNNNSNSRYIRSTESEPEENSFNPFDIPVCFHSMWFSPVHQ